jgi:hypothetical protein
MPKSGTATAEKPTKEERKAKAAKQKTEHREKASTEATVALDAITTLHETVADGIDKGQQGKDLVKDFQELKANAKAYLKSLNRLSLHVEGLPKADRKAAAAEADEGEDQDDDSEGDEGEDDEAPR